MTANCRESPPPTHLPRIVGWQRNGPTACVPAWVRRPSAGPVTPGSGSEAASASTAKADALGPDEGQIGCAVPQQVWHEREDHD